MKRRHVWVGLGCALTLALGVTAASARRGLAGLQRSSDRAAGAPGGGELAGKPAVIVRVETAAVEPAPNTQLRAYGTTRARERAVLSFPVPGRLVERPIRVGDRVRTGQVLARLDPSPFRHGVALAQATDQEIELRLEQLGRDRARVERLHSQGVVSQSDLEATSSEEQALTARRAQVVAQLLEAERAERDAVLRAPYAGVINAVHLEPREFAAPGAPVVEVSGDSGLEVKVQVAEASRSLMDGQSSVTVDFPLLGLAGIAGRISQLGDAAERIGGLFPVLVEVDDPRLSPGLSAEVVLHTAQRPSLAVPLEAVINRSGRMPYVFRLRPQPLGKLAERVPVRLLDLRGDQLVVESSTGRELVVGDQVITDGHAQISAGTAVEVD